MLFFICLLFLFSRTASSLRPHITLDSLLCFKKSINEATGNALGHARTPSRMESVLLLDAVSFEIVLRTLHHKNHSNGCLSCILAFGHINKIFLEKTSQLRLCLFPGKYFPGNYFLNFPVFICH